MPPPPFDHTLLKPFQYAAGRELGRLPDEVVWCQGTDAVVQRQATEVVVAVLIRRGCAEQGAQNRCINFDNDTSMPGSPASGVTYRCCLRQTRRYRQ